MRQVNYQIGLGFSTGYACLIFLGMFLSSGCASLTGYQDGRSLGEGNGEASVSLNFSQSPAFTDLEDSVDVTYIPRLAFPNLELGGRYGLTDRLDLLLKLNTNLNVGVGAKYQLVGDRMSPFAMSLGAEVGTFGLVVGLWNLQLPAYFSYHPNEKISIYASPRYIYQFTTIGGLEGWNYLGGNAGILLGKRNKFGIDLGYYQVGTIDTEKIGLFSVGMGGKFFFGSETGSSGDATLRKKRR
ncbi:MAG: hypothetical protein LW630_05815 [Saprospiraceae bacterium]|nr:hypothetical protein [Saprospiraceae bacterium]